MSRTRPAAGNPISMDEAKEDVLTWTYDALNQLARERRSGDSAYDITYTYDAVGNRLTKVDAGAITTYTYDAANELLTEDAAGSLTTYTYDGNGNTLAVNAAGAVTTMAWSYEDEMLTVQPSTGGRVTMAYDGDHLRRKRQNGSGTTKYVWDDQQVLLETNGNGVTQARYTLAPFGYGDLVSMRRSNASSFYHFDAIGTTRALTADDEWVTDTYLYSAFGNVLATTGSTTNPYLYIGKLGYQQETGLSGYYLRRRYYQPETGRFVSRDPVRTAGGSQYAYVRNGPTSSVDPSGLQWWKSVQCLLKKCPTWAKLGAGGAVGSGLMYYVCCVVGGYCKGKPGMNHAQRMRLCVGYPGVLPDYPATVTVTDPKTGQTAICTHNPNTGKDEAYDPATGRFHP